MNLQEIKQALKEGKQVFWCNDAYEVIKDSIDQYLIKSSFSRSPNYVGLTWANGHTLNGKEEDFYAV